MNRCLPAAVLPTAVLLSLPGAALARDFKQETAAYTFAYSYPANAAAIPALRARLEADRARQLVTIAKDARQGAVEAKKDGYPFRKHDWSQTWQVVTDLPGWLSLSATFYTYTGGAHGMIWSGAMLWDRGAKTARSPLDLFVSKAALQKAIQPAFCAALNRQRAEKRREPVRPGSTNDFDKCINPVAETVILGSTNRKTFTRIGILVAPYSAGPYAEGSYEVTLPITPAVLAALKPRYRSAFTQ